MASKPYDGTAQPDHPKHPDCAACKQDWPIHLDGEGKPIHIDLFATREYGVMVPCPTPEWLEMDDDDEEEPLP